MRIVDRQISLCSRSPLIEDAPEHSGSKVGLIIVRKAKKIVGDQLRVEILYERDDRDGHHACVNVCMCVVRTCKFARGDGGGERESERLQCWSHVIAVAAERSFSGVSDSSERSVEEWKKRKRKK